MGFRKKWILLKSKLPNLQIVRIFYGTWFTQNQNVHFIMIIFVLLISPLIVSIHLNSSQIKQSNRKIEILLNLKYYSHRTRSSFPYLGLKSDNNHKNISLNCKIRQFLLSWMKAILLIKISLPYYAVYILNVRSYLFLRLWLTIFFVIIQIEHILTNLAPECNVIRRQ